MRRWLFVIWRHHNMPVSTPYAKLFASINSGALQDGGIAAALSDTVDLSAESTVGWPASGAGAPKWEIYGYPPLFAEPAGWSTDGTTNAYYYTGVTPPQFTLTYWGKYMLRLTVQGGGGDKTDESTAISVEHASGLVDLGKYETNQFNAGWDDDHRANLRVIATGLGAAKAPADAQYLVGAAHADLSAEVVWTSIGTTVAFASTATQPCTFSRTDSGTTNTALTARTLIALGGTVANGFGVQEVYQAEGAGGTAIDAGSVGFSWVDITGGSEDSKCTIGVRTGGAALASCAEFSGSGSTLIRHAATANDTLPVLTLRRTTSDAGFGQTGIGGSVVFELEDGAGNTDTAATLAVDYLDATSTSENTRFLFRGQVAGSLTDLLSLRGQTVRIHGLAGGGSQLLTINNDGDVAASASALPAPLTLVVDDATANDVSTVLTLVHTTTDGGNGAAGIGARMVFSAEDAAGNTEVAGYITGRLTTTTNGAEVSEIGLWTRTGGSAPVKNFTLAGDGTVTLTALAGAATRLCTASTTGALGTVSGTAGMVTVASSGAPTVSNPAILVSGSVPANISAGINIGAIPGTLQFLSTSDVPVLLGRTTSSSPATVADAIMLQHFDDTGVGAVGGGVGVIMRVYDANGDAAEIGRIAATMTDATGGTHASRFGFEVASAGALTEVATLTNGGVWTTDGAMKSDAGFDSATATTLPIGGSATRVDILSAVATGDSGAGVRIHNDAGVRSAGYLCEFGDDSTFARKSGVDYRGIYDGPVLAKTALKTGAYDAKMWEQVLCDPSTGGFQVTIPDGTTADAGKRIGVKNYGTSTNTITLDTTTPNGIQGGTATITTGWGYVELECVGADGWIIVSRVT